MPINDNNLKKIYNETAGVITKLCFEKRINENEMYFLLNLLDFVCFEKRGDDLIASIVKWQHLNNDSELDEIIKETLLTLDFSSEDSIAKMAAMIQELLN